MKIALGIIATLAAGAMSLTTRVQAGSYNAVTDFSVTNGNPNSVWSYLVDGSLLSTVSTAGSPNNLIWWNGGNNQTSWPLELE